MKILDIILVVLLIFGAVRGFQTGLLLELIQFTSFFIALIVAFNLMDNAVLFLEQHFDQPKGLLSIFSFVGLFIIVIVALNLLGKGIKSLLDMTLLGSLDDIAGAALGIFKWALMISIFFWIFTYFDITISAEYRAGTYVYPVIESIAPWLLEQLATVFPFIQDLIDQSKEMIKKDEQMAFTLT